MTLGTKIAKRGAFFIINKILFVINIAFSFALLLAYLAPFVSPDFIWYFAIPGIAYTWLLIINIIFLFYWIASFSFFKAIIPLCCIAIGYNYIGDVFKWGKDAGDIETSAKIITFNGNYFGIFSNNMNTSPFFDYLKDEDPDILCFQEFVWENNNRKNYIKKLKKALPGGYHSFFKIYKAMDTIHREYGMYIYSKYKIIDSGYIKFPNSFGNAVQYIDIQTSKDTFRIYNIHLQSIKFSGSDFQFLDNNESKDTIISRTGNVLEKLKNAWVLRATQAELVRNHMDACPYKIIACGDFNDTPVSYSYHTIKGKMNDAFCIYGSGFGKTYTGRMPHFRIDYIFADPSLPFTGYAPRNNFWSDHRMIEAYINM